MNTDSFSHINWLAVLVAAIAFFAVGAVWYSFLFRDAWIKASGVSMNDPNAKKGASAMFLSSFILIVITVVGLALLTARLGSGGWMTGLKVGLVAGVCFCTTAISNSYLYERRPLALHLINSLYNVVGCVVAGIIIAVWR
jgi:hypothetical protein